PGWSYFMSLLHRFGLMTLAAVFAAGTAAQAANVNLPAGSTIDATIQQEMNSKTAQDGQTFTAVTSSGSRIRGHLSQVARANIGKALGTGLGGLVGVAGGALLAANTSSNIDVPAGSLLRLKLDAPLVVRP